MLPPLQHIGRIAGKHGFKGALSVALNDDSLASSIKKGNFLFIEIDGKGVPFLIESWNRKACIVCLFDIPSEDIAVQFEGLDILIEGSDLVKPKNGEIITVGFTIKDEATGYQGTIVSIEDYPAGSMLILENEKGEQMIPLIKEWVIKSDIENKIIYMNLPQGLTEI